MLELPDIYTSKFIEEHSEDDFREIALKAARTKSVNASLAVRQISGRQKIKFKIPEFYNCKNLIYPPGLSLEQCSSSLTARYKSALFSGNTFLDMTGGFGVDFVFLSEFFERGIYVENNALLCQIAGYNFNQLELKNFTVQHADCRQIIDSIDAVDLIYLDPHRRDIHGRKKFFVADCEPNVIEIQEALIRKSTRVLIKLSPMLDITQAINDLQFVTEVHVVAVENDCKEILFVLSDKINGEIEVKTINFKKGNAQKFDFYYNKEAEQQVEYTDEISAYIYEPNAAIMKSGAFKSVASAFGLRKFHPNTHIYTSSELISNFPGRVFKLKRILSDLTNIKQINKILPRANISLRNYKMTVEDFRKKTGIKDGGNVYLFGFRDVKNSFRLIETEQTD